MITFPEDVIKIQGALQKFDDATIKLCDVHISQHTTLADVELLVEAINALAAVKMALSKIIPAQGP